MVTHAGLTLRDFHEEFASVEDCLLAAVDRGQALVTQALVDALKGERHWLTRVRLTLFAILRFLDSEPGWARLLVVETPAAGLTTVEHRDRGLARLAELLERGSPRASSSDRVTLQRGLTGELVIGGVFAVLHARMLKRVGVPLIELAPSLMSLIVLPYLGPEAASAELTRRPPGTPAPKVGLETRAASTRATYRTALVLRAIRGVPRSSNREIAAAAGLGDEGQTSRLLSRLQRQGLIENVGLGQAYGEPNAWLLTSEGTRVAELIGHEFARAASRPHGGPVRGRPACQK